MELFRTRRLDLIPASPGHLEAELASPACLAALLDATVPDGWPPGEYDRPAIEFFRARLTQHPECLGWYSWYAIERDPEGKKGRLAGAGGYFGPPTADGSVEIGYSIMPEFRGRGLAGELAHALGERAFTTTGVTHVLAHTRPENLASVRVLERCGFRPAGPGREEGSIRFVCGAPGP